VSRDGQDHPTGGASSAAPPESPPGLDLAFPPRATHISGRRAIAHLIDGLIYGIGVGIVAAIAGLLSDVALGIVFLLSIPGVVAFYVLTQRKSGRSPGKKMMVIKVVDKEGAVPDTGALVRRSLPLVIEWIYVVAWFSMMTSETRQRLGDRWAHTYVIGYDRDDEAVVSARDTYRHECLACGEVFESEAEAERHVETRHPGQFDEPAAAISQHR